MPSFIRKNIGDIYYTSRVIANFVINSSIILRTLYTRPQNYPGTKQKKMATTLFVFCYVFRDK